MKDDSDGSASLDVRNGDRLVGRKEIPRNETAISHSAFLAFLARNRV
jgi:hypothetical protein